MAHNDLFEETLHEFEEALLEESGTPEELSSDTLDRMEIARISGQPMGTVVPPPQRTAPKSVLLPSSRASTRHSGQSVRL